MNTVFKTSFPISIDSREQAEKFMTELHKNGELITPDEDAHQIIWASGMKPLKEELHHLNHLLSQIESIPDFDPWEFALALTGHVMEEDEAVEPKFSELPHHYIIIKPLPANMLNAEEDEGAISITDLAVCTDEGGLVIFADKDETYQYLINEAIVGIVVELPKA